MAGTSTTPLRGHCLCGACHFELAGPHNFVGHCHCESCRRATASPYTTWIGQKNGRWTLTGEPMRRYESTPGRVRNFCSTCGTPMSYASTDFPTETHFYAALLENPEDVHPKTQYHVDERLAWVHMSDDVTSA